MICSAAAVLPPASLDRRGRQRAGWGVRWRWPQDERWHKLLAEEERVPARPTTWVLLLAAVASLVATAVALGQSSKPGGPAAIAAAAVLRRSSA